jgi:hypothetical protein
LRWLGPAPLLVGKLGLEDADLTTKTSNFAEYLMNSTYMRESTMHAQYHREAAV